MDVVSNAGAPLAGFMGVTLPDTEAGMAHCMNDVHYCRAGKARVRVCHHERTRCGNRW